MSEHWSLPMIRANLSFSFRLHFLCYTSSCMPSRLLHLKVPQILYSMHVLFSYLYRIFIFTAQILPLWQFQHSVWQLWLLQSPHCQISETTNFPGYTCVYLQPCWACPASWTWDQNWTSQRSTVGSIEYWHSHVGGQDVPPVQLRMSPPSGQNVPPDILP